MLIGEVFAKYVADVANNNRLVPLEMTINSVPGLQIKKKEMFVIFH